MKKLLIKILISFVALTLSIIHLIYPNLKLDTIFICLLVISIIPWFEILFKSVEINGIGKVEFRDLTKASDEISDSGLLANIEINTQTNNDSNINYDFIELALQNQALALVSFRIELEKTLKKLANQFLKEPNNRSLTNLLKDLSNTGVLSSQEVNSLMDMISTLNKAAHGMDYDPRIAEWILEVCPKILESLTAKLNQPTGRMALSETSEPFKHWIDISYESNLNKLSDIENIIYHQTLWEQEKCKILCALETRLDQSILSQLHALNEGWNNQFTIEQKFASNLPEIDIQTGSAGRLVRAMYFMDKKREYVLWLSEISNIYQDYQIPY